MKEECWTDKNERLTGISSSSKTTLWGKPTLLTHSTVSPALIVTLEGSKTRPPPSAPSLTVAALALKARPTVAMLIPAALAILECVDYQAHTTADCVNFYSHDK